MTMIFSIIYSCDVQVRTRLVGPPPSQCHLWQCTERDGGPNGGQMDWNGEPEWKRGRHRKYCAILNREQFEEFLAHTALYPEDVETMGSLGAPGAGYGWMPAISFSEFERPGMILSAYVTPVPKRAYLREKPCGEAEWERIRAAVLAVYS